MQRHSSNLSRYWHRVPRTARRVFGWVVGLTLVAVVSVNGAVRCAGGAPSLVSVEFFPQKATAVALLMSHSLFGEEPPVDTEGVVRRAARRHKVPECFALAVARVESGLRPTVISSAGAMGVMQLMPATARGLKVETPFDVRDNVDGGVRYLRKLWRRYKGDRKRVAAAYNAGPGAVPRRGPVPGFAHGYIRRIMRQRCR